MAHAVGTSPSLRSHLLSPSDDRRRFDELRDELARLDEPEELTVLAQRIAELRSEAARPDHDHLWERIRAELDHVEDPDDLDRGAGSDGTP